MSLRSLPYKRIQALLRDYVSTEEEDKAASLMRELRAARLRGYLTPAECEKVCRWKSPRTLPLIRRNSSTEIRKATTLALSTRSERRRLAALTELHGVSVPMASAILMLLYPKRYGVIDIRVWQLLHHTGTVTANPRGTGFNFKNWYQFLMIVRYFAGEFGVTARDIERALFLAHRDYQKGKLYQAYAS